MVRNVVARSLSGAKSVLRRFPRAAAAYRYLRDVRQLRRQPRETPFGFRFAGNAMMEAGTFEPAETALVRSLLGHAEVFLNIGANIGYYCCHALQQGKRTYAFEPVELNVQFLLKNIVANGWQQKIELFPLALLESPGIVELYGGGTGASTIPGWAGSSHKDVHLVPASSVDVVLGDRLSGQRVLIVMDVEGAELGVLRGAQKLLQATPRPIWMVEVNIDAHQPRPGQINPTLLPTFELFWAAGYDAYTADDERRLVTPDEVRSIAQSGSNTLRTHNFLFLDRHTSDLVSETRRATRG